MKCEIPGPNVKIFARTIVYLARIGNEIHIQPRDNELCLNCVNQAKTTFGSVRFASRFFLKFEVDDTNDDDMRGCKVASRNVLAMFKLFLTHAPHVAHISFPVDSTKIFFEFKYDKNNWNKSYTVSVLDEAGLMSPVIPSNYTNKIIGSHKVFRHIVSGFHKSTKELSFNITATSIVVRNYIDDPEGDRDSIRSSYELNISEFETFFIKNPGNIGLSYPDLRAFVNFAESNELNVKMSFSDPGEPVHGECAGSSGMYTATFFAATLIDTGYLARKFTESVAGSQASSVAVPPTGPGFSFRAGRGPRTRSVQQPASDAGPSSSATSIDHSMPVPVPPTPVMDDDTDDDDAMLSQLPIIRPDPVQENKSNDVIFETESPVVTSNRPTSPPRKRQLSPHALEIIARTRFIFRRCFDDTNSRLAESSPEILAGPSDDEESDNL